MVIFNTHCICYENTFELNVGVLALWLVW